MPRKKAPESNNERVNFSELDVYKFVEKYRACFQWARASTSNIEKSSKNKKRIPEQLM